MSYRADLDALAARHAALAAEVATKTRELDVATKLLDEAKAKARLPVLPNIRVASPCSADWNQMQGDDRVRACGSCQKNVYNLSSMTRDEAEALIVAREGRLCVRYFQRSDGTILLKDCAVGTRRARKRRLFAAGAAAMLAGGGLLGYELTRPEPEQASVVQGAIVVAEPVMGELAVPPEPTAEEPAEAQGELHEVMGDIASEDVLEVKGKMAAE